MLFNYSVTVSNESCMMRAINPDGSTIKTPEVADQPDAVLVGGHVPLNQDRPPVQITLYRHDIDRGFTVKIYTVGPPQ